MLTDDDATATGWSIAASTIDWSNCAHSILTKMQTKNYPQLITSSVEYSSIEYLNHKIIKSCGALRRTDNANASNLITCSHGSESVVRTTVKVNGNGKIWLSADAKLNPSTDRHQIWNTWLITSGISSSKKLGSIPRGFCPHMPEIHTQNLRMFTSLFQFFRAPANEPVRSIFAFNTSYDLVLRKVVPFGGENN